MHETGLVNALIGEVKRIAAEHDARQVQSIRLGIGALTAISPDHLRAHFTLAARGTVAAGARLDITRCDNPADSRAYTTWIESVDLLAADGS